MSDDLDDDHEAAFEHNETFGDAAGRPARDCPEALSALRYAFVGFFCCGIVLGPIAIWKGIEAHRAIRRDPALSGRGKANLAIALGVFEIFLFISIAIGRLSTSFGPG